MNDKPIKVKVISTGVTSSTKIIDAVSGRDIAGVRRITFDMDGNRDHGKIVPLVLEINDYELEFEGDATIIEGKVNKCDCGSKKSNSGHFGWCSSLSKDEK